MSQCHQTSDVSYYDVISDIRNDFQASRREINITSVDGCTMYVKGLIQELAINPTSMILLFCMRTEHFMNVKIKVH